MTDSIFKSNLDLIVICGFFMQSIYKKITTAAKSKKKELTK